MEVNEFNADESPEKCIARLCREQQVDMVIQFDAADRRANMTVLGFFVLPDLSLVKSSAEHPA